MDITRHPEPYDFLFTAGVVDRSDPACRVAKRCSVSLAKIANLNGSYKDLCGTFRESMRIALACPDDTQVKVVLQQIADACKAPEHVAPHIRPVIRQHLSRIARYWPEKPNTILSPLKER